MSTPAVLDDLTWPEDALNAIIQLSARGHEFAADDLAREFRKPPRPNMAGPVFTRAKDLGYIVGVGYRPSTAKSRKGGVIRTWTLNNNRKATL